jgi:hypothetical protein
MTVAESLAVAAGAHRDPSGVESYWRIPLKSLLLLAFLPALVCAAPALQIVRPVISQTEGGAPDPPGFEHSGGDVLYLSCRIGGFAKSAEEKLHLTYSVQAFDPKGVPLTEIYKDEMETEVLPQDKEWMPKVETAAPIPPLVLPGEYKIVIKAEDLQAKTSTETALPFRVRGRIVEPSDKLVVRDFRFYRAEEDVQPLAKPVYRAGSGLWAKFDITGFKYGPRNKIDVSYEITILSATGKTLWTQPEPATEEKESFYPTQYVPASMGLSLQTVKPAEYTMVVKVTDAIGDQTCEVKQVFTVE